MKTKILFLALMFSFIAFKASADKIITIKITKIDGDGSGNYRDVSRVVEEVVGMSGTVEEIKINIGCGGAGPDRCPSFRPVAGGPVEDVDESISNYMEQRILEIENSISEGITDSKDVRVVSILLSNGETKLFRVVSKWVGLNNNNSQIDVHLESYAL